MTSEHDRAFAMRRAGSGAYIWPSDDGTTVYLIASYTEDGSSEICPAGSRWWDVQCMPMAHAEHEAIDGYHPRFWAGWQMVGTAHPTRRAALIDAIEHSHRTTR